MTVNSFTAELSADWDIQIDAAGGIKMTRGTPGICQNVATEGKNFKGGQLYYSDSGIAWLSDALGQKFQRPIIASRLREAAEKVQGVRAVEQVQIDDFDPATRTVTGEVVIETEAGENGRAVII